MKSLLNSFVWLALFCGLLGLGAADAFATQEVYRSWDVIGTAAPVPSGRDSGFENSNIPQGREHIARLIDRQARAEGIPAPLAHAVVTVESRYNPRARGAAGEVGLMQIKPQTARGMGFGGSVSALYDPQTNIKWGMKYLGEAYRLAGGDVCGTILRYNAGHGARRMNPISARYCTKVRTILRERHGIRAAKL